MSYFKWEDKNSVGIKSIDEQHKNIIQLNKDPRRKQRGINQNQNKAS